MSTMTSERLSELRLWVELARYADGEGAGPDLVTEACDAVEALQAELAETESAWFGVWVERDGEPGFWRAVQGSSVRLETTFTEATRTALALTEGSVGRTDSIGWRYSVRPIGLRGQVDRLKAELAEERAKRDEALMLALGLRRDLHNEIVRFCCLDSNFTDALAEHAVVEKGCDDLRAKLAACVAALEWYADPDNYRRSNGNPYDPTDYPSAAEIDEGASARDALAAAKGGAT